jgi:rhodanese-related sulfurtransferase
MGFELPLIIETDALHNRLDDDNLVVIDLSMPKSYKEGHIPGAIHISL